ncbi:MAG: alpha-amylase family glycosyl hydrolase, partial [Pseudomonadota bacterium]|nr:alpha-amylase family glycosyl hydrolase [Pseudomonadota bacterium]
MTVAFLAMALQAGVGGPVAADAWLNGDPDAIQQRAPGFYKEGEHWYAILHVEPSVTRVRLEGDFTDGLDHAVELTRTPDGRFWWHQGTDASFTRSPQAGDRYRFVLNKGDGPDLFRQDPAARRVESSSLQDSSLVTLDSEYQWQDNDWFPPDWYDYIIYQLHPLRFTDRNQDGDGKPLPPLQQIAEELDNDGSNDYLNDLGVTAIQLLPLAEFQGDHSWGYNPSFFYAIESAYGTPGDLKKLVDTAHQNGIAVILDVVYNHGGTDDNILWQIAQEDHHQGTYYDGDTKWGPMINFDHEVSRHFFVQNILYLAREFHIDGFRFDATRPVHIDDDWNIKLRGSGGGWGFLREMRRLLKAVHPGIILIAEELPNDWYITRERVHHAHRGDYHGPFDAQWADPFHDNFKEVLRGAPLDRLPKAFTPFGDSWQDALIYTESHDEVGNEDARIARVAREGKGWEMAQIAAAGTLLGRGIPMVFMGQEAGERLQFGQDDGKLGEHDPGTGDTWWDDRLPLHEYEQDPGRSKVRNWYKRLIGIRKEAARSLAWPDIRIAHLHDENGIAAFTRDGGNYLVVLNFKVGDWPA